MRAAREPVRKRRPSWRHGRLAGLLLLSVASAATARGFIDGFLPAEPHALEIVHARVTFSDSCPRVVDVRSAPGATRIVWEPAPPDDYCQAQVIQYNVALGAYAQGLQPVEVGHFDGDLWIVDHRRGLRIGKTPSSPPPRPHPDGGPGADNSDTYWNPRAPGWSLQVFTTGNGRDTRLTGFLYDHDSEGNPTWHVIDAARESAAFEGTVYRTRGVPFGAAGGVALIPVGTARIDFFFDTTSGRVAVTRDGVTVVREFERFRFR